MGTLDERRLDDEAVNSLKGNSVDYVMAEKVRAFRDLSRRLRMQTSNRPQTPSEVLIREDRDSGHRNA